MLDLDHTVVNSAKFSEVTEPELAASLQAGASDVFESLMLLSLTLASLWSSDARHNPS